MSTEGINPHSSGPTDPSYGEADADSKIAEEKKLVYRGHSVSTHACGHDTSKTPHDEKSSSMTHTAHKGSKTPVGDARKETCAACHVFPSKRKRKKLLSASEKKGLDDLSTILESAEIKIDQVQDLIRYLETDAAKLNKLMGKASSSLPHMSEEIRARQAKINEKIQELKDVYAQLKNAAQDLDSESFNALLEKRNQVAGTAQGLISSLRADILKELNKPALCKSHLKELELGFKTIAERSADTMSTAMYSTSSLKRSIDRLKINSSEVKEAMTQKLLSCHQRAEKLDAIEEEIRLFREIHNSEKVTELTEEKERLVLELKELFSSLSSMAKAEEKKVTPIGEEEEILMEDLEDEEFTCYYALDAFRVDTEDLKNAKAFTEHLQHTPGLVKRLIKFSKKFFIATPAIQCSLGILERKEAVLKLSSKVKKLQTLWESGETPSEKQKLSTGDMQLLDQVLQNRNSLEDLLRILPNKEVHELRECQKFLSETFPREETKKDWEGASLYTLDLKKGAYYDAAASQSRLGRAVGAAGKKLFKMFTGGGEGHAAMLYQSGEGTYISHVTDIHRTQSLSPNTPSDRGIMIPYRVLPENLLHPKAKGIVLEHCSKEELQTLWQEASSEVQKEYGALEEKASNSTKRQIGSALGGHKKSKKKAVDYTKWTAIPSGSEYKHMICSEFATVSMIVTANKFNALLVEHLAAKTPPVVVKGMEKIPLAKLPFDSREKRSHMTPHRLVSMLGKGKSPIVEEVPASAKTKHFFRLPKGVKKKS